MALVALNLQVDLWNAIKFVLMQLFISVPFANSWSFFVRRHTARLLSQNREVALRSTNLGRLTPANVIHEACDEDRNCFPARIIVVVVNLLLLAFVLLTEFGSSSIGRVDILSLPVVNRHTIKQFHDEQNKRIRDTLKVRPFSLQQDLLPSSLQALYKITNNTDALDVYVLQEHLRDTDENAQLLRNKEDDLVLRDVCGIELFESLSPCARRLQRDLGLSNITSALLFSVTRHYKLDIPELGDLPVDELFVHVRLDAILHGAMEPNSKLSTFKRIDLRLRNVTGVCAGLPHMLNFDLFHPSVGFLKNCVLVVGNARFVLTHARSFEFSNPVSKHLTKSPEGHEWSRAGGVAAMPAAAIDAISFNADIGPLFALANIMRLADVRDQLRDFDALPIGVTLRKTVLLRALGLVGPYARKQVVRVRHLDSAVAAVDELFFAGIAALCLLVGSIAFFGLVCGDASPHGKRLPVGVREGLLMLNQLHCTCRRLDCAAGSGSQLATFVNGSYQAEVKCSPCCDAKEEALSEFDSVTESYNSEDDTLPSKGISIFNRCSLTKLCFSY